MQAAPPPRNTVLRILDLLRPYGGYIAVLLLSTAVMGGLAAVPILITGSLVDKVFTNRQMEYYFPLGLAMVATWSLYKLVYLFQCTLFVWIGQHFILDIRTKLYRHMLSLSLRFFGRHSAGKLVNRLMGDSGTVQSLMASSAMQIFFDLVIAFCASVISITLSWRLYLALVFFLVIFVLNFRLFRGKISTYSRFTRTAYDRLASGVQNRLGGYLAVKTFGTEERENLLFAEQAYATTDFMRLQNLASNEFSRNVLLLQSLGYGIIYFLGCALVLQGQMTYGDVLAFASYTLMLLMPAVRLSNLADVLQQVAVATDRLCEIFDEVPEISDSPDARDMPTLKGKVDFQNIKFHYNPGIEIIKGFELHVQPGQTIALIGPTGCGKSTILNLLTRYYDVTGGAILLDDVDIRQIKLGSLRRHFGVVLQESNLFSTTVLENIRYSRPDATLEEVIAAAKAAEIHDFILTLEQGYDTMLGDFGVELSVGQKQRINIARAICADPAIIIMDEATSSLDSDSEQAIQKAMDRILQGRTSFIVAHRLSTIRNADKIILLDDGVICEQGTHDELMAIPDGHYRELYLKHIGKGVIEDDEEGQR